LVALTLYWTLALGALELVLPSSSVCGSTLVMNQYYLRDVEPGLPFVGATKDFHFDCPKIEPGADAVLMFQTRDVDHDKNVMQINPATAEQPTVFGGIPVSPSKDTWNGNIMVIRRDVLRETNNVLHIESAYFIGW
jgi:hypothetical protein